MAGWRGDILPFLLLEVLLLLLLIEVKDRGCMEGGEDEREGGDVGGEEDKEPIREGDVEMEDNGERLEGLVGEEGVEREGEER